MTDQNTFLGTEKISTLLAKLSGPIIIGIMMQGLYNVVDTIFVARGVGTLAIGGLSIVMPIQIMIISIGIMFGYGMASIIARSLGAQDYGRAGRAAGNAVLMALLVGGFITVFVLMFLTPVLNILGATPSLFPYSMDYLRIVILGTTFLLLTIVFNDIFRSEGKANLLMQTILVGTVLNIVLDWFFIFVLKMGVSGAAVATVISQATSALFAFYFFATKKTFVPIELKQLVPDPAILREMYLLGIPSFLYQFGLSVIIVIINNALRLYQHPQADLVISSYGVLWRINVFLILPIIGFVSAFQTVIGFNYGAHRPERVKECIRQSIWITTIYSVVIFAVMFGIPQYIIGVFSADQALIREGTYLSRFFFVCFPLSGIFMIGTNLFLALGKAKASFILSLSRIYYFMIPALLILPRVSGIETIWYAYPFADIACTILVIIFLYVEMKSLSKASGETTGSIRNISVDKAV